MSVHLPMLPKIFNKMLSYPVEILSNQADDKRLMMMIMECLDGLELSKNAPLNSSEIRDNVNHIMSAMSNVNGISW